MKYKILAIVFIGILSWSGLVPTHTYGASPEVKIEDAVLEKEIRAELKLEEGTVLDYTNLQKLTSLYPKGKEKIKSVKGLNMARNLEQLYLPNQEITDISPLGSLYNLTFLAINNNQIQNACPIANLSDLRKLVISNNQIEEIGCFSRLTGLTDLLASNNKIKDIQPLTKLKLGWLDVSNNPVTDISSIGVMNKLRQIYVTKDSLNEKSNALLDQLEQSGVAVNRASASSDKVSGISVLVNDDRVLFDLAPLVDAGTTLVQFRPLFEKLGFVIQWDETTRTIQAEKQGAKITLQVDNPKATLNGDSNALTVAPRNIEGSIFVPIRFVGEASKFVVTWESSSKTIYLQSTRTIVTPDEKLKVTLGGNWLSKEPPANLNYQIFATSGNNALISTSESKSLFDKILTLEEYEVAIKKSLEPKKITKFSAGKSLRINGLDAVQFSYSVNGTNGEDLTVTHTIIDGKYSYFNVFLFSGELVYSEINKDYQNILQTLEEIKTPYQLSKEKFGQLKPTERLLEAARYYRKLGFFESVKGLTSQEFDNKMLELEKKFTDWNPFDSSKYYNDLAELSLLIADEDRVWVEDWDLDVSKGKNAYLTTLEQWSKISRGAFQPTDIKEIWDAEEGPITVSFKLNGQERVIHPEHEGSYLNTYGLLKEINDMIKPSGYQFAVVENDDEEVMVIALKAEEKMKLQQDRYIDFDFITLD
ncbi:stalk domain-containing protein [Paenibacillus qinlingensis]|uniref:stalk domain-containing protein n=1 Tax=Paenibacillus qinlingensis TaxID=1837343 RepID=UPI001566108B|nr:stalk domain-containing protein [Paenibacillus qinlingensis]NQX61181.1 leucine-rich repeat domain-containing protein [Paenibacillus qinlingensis]